MAQHFLLSSAARTLSLASVARMTDEEAHAKFAEIRWADNGGQPSARAAAASPSTPTRPASFGSAKRAQHQFCVTQRHHLRQPQAGGPRLPDGHRHLVSTAPRASARLQLARDLDVQYRTAFVLAHKLREAMAAEMPRQTLGGTVEVDGAYFGGHIRPANLKETASTAALPRTRPASAAWSWSLASARAAPWLQSPSRKPMASRSSPRSCSLAPVVHADEASHWDALHAHFRDEAHQPHGRVLARRRLHQPSRKLFSSPAPHGRRPASSRQPALPLPVRQPCGLA